MGEAHHHVRVEEPLPAGAQRIHDAVAALLTDERSTELAEGPEAEPEDFDASLMLE